MNHLNPDKLHVKFSAEISSESGSLPRRYTLTHSDLTGDLFLTVGKDYDRKQISGLYTRLMRDEVLAEMINHEESLQLRVYCHVSGGIVIGTCRFRDSIFHAELPLVLEAIRYGDREFFIKNAELDLTTVKIYFQSSNNKYNRVEDWGSVADYVRR